MIGEIRHAPTFSHVLNFETKKKQQIHIKVINKSVNVKAAVGRACLRTMQLWDEIVGGRACHSGGERYFCG